jgi:ribose transport system permease protein
MSQHPARTYRVSLRAAMKNYGMVFVLLFLMLVFSLLTVKEQRATGPDAGRQLADQIMTQYGSGVYVFIAVPASADDNAFAAAMEESITAAGGTVLGSVVGTPADARQKLEQLFGEGTKIDVVAVTGASAEWKIWARFSQLTPQQFAVPQPGRWPSFLTRSNLIGVANQTAIYAIIAIGMTMVIIGGGIDLSAGSLVALSSVTATILLRDYAGGVFATPVSVIFACLAGILLTAAAGFFNGLMVTQASLPPFLVTLAMMLMAKGLAMRLSNFTSINAVPPSFRWLGGESTAGLPNPVLIMIVLYGLAHVIMQRSVFGRVLYAIGGNAEAARLAGIHVHRNLLLVYTISGALAGLGGIILSSRLNAGDPKYGDMFELNVIAAVVVGGTSLMGGEGRMLGTLIGAFIIAIIRNGMNLMSVAPSNQQIVLGAVLLLAVLADRLKRRSVR